MSFSSITQGSDSRLVRLTEPLAQAWELARQVRLLEFDRSNDARWLRGVRTLAEALRGAIARHVAEAERDTTRSLRTLAGCGRASLAARTTDDHAALLSASAALAAKCAIRQVEAIRVVVDVAEAAIELEMLIARHHNRLARLSELEGAEPSYLTRGAALTASRS